MADKADCFGRTLVDLIKHRNHLAATRLLGPVRIFCMGDFNNTEKALREAAKTITGIGPLSYAHHKDDSLYLVSETQASGGACLAFGL